jgi:hypothetical protein
MLRSRADRITPSINAASGRIENGQGCNPRCTTRDDSGIRSLLATEPRHGPPSTWRGTQRHLRVIQNVHDTRPTSAAGTQANHTRMCRRGGAARLRLCAFSGPGYSQVEDRSIRPVQGPGTASRTRRPAPAHCARRGGPTRKPSTTRRRVRSSRSCRSWFGTGAAAMTGARRSDAQCACLSSSRQSMAWTFISSMFARVTGMRFR